MDLVGAFSSQIVILRVLAPPSSPYLLMSWMDTFTLPSSCHEKDGDGIFGYDCVHPSTRKIPGLG